MSVKTDWYKPRTGNAFIALFTFGDRYTDSATDIRGYAQVKLKQPLKSGCIYKATCFILLATKVNYDCGYFSPESQASDGFGMYFSKDSVYVTDYIKPYKALTQYIPQVSNPSGYLLSDSVNYQELSGFFTATGGEEWLILGNFKGNEHTITANNDATLDWGTRRMNSIYSIDDVSVEEWKPDLVGFKDTLVCSDSALVLTLPKGLKNYKWSTGETTQQVNIQQDGMYTVEASNGCTILRDTFYRHSIMPYTMPLTIGKDTFFCSIPANYTLKSSVHFDSYLWSTGSAANQLPIQTAGKYWLRGTYACGTLSDTISITQFDKPPFILIPGNDTVLCSNQSLLIQTTQTLPLSDFLWNDGSTENHLLIQQPGVYSLKAHTDKGCEVTDSISVKMIYPPVSTYPKDTLACEELPLMLSVYTDTINTIKWYDGSITANHRINSSGIYWVTVSNNCYSVEDTVYVTLVNCQLTIPNLITVNEDSFNDFFEIQTTIQRNLELTIYNSWGNLIYKDAAYKSNWNATDVAAGIYYYQIRDPLLNKTHKGWLQVMK